MEDKKKILFVPAWWPCGFFKEQMEITNDTYSSYVLYGGCSVIGMKKRLRQGRQKNAVSLEGINRAVINMSWVKYKSESKRKKQQQKLTSFVDEGVLMLLNGSYPDIVHIQSISNLSVFVVEWAKSKGIPVILTEHILFIRRSNDYFSRLIESVYNKVDEVLCVSNYVYRNLLTSGFCPKRASVIGNLVDDRYVPENLSKIKKNGRVLFVATHKEDKDIDVLIDVAEKIKSKGIIIDIAGLTGKSLITAEKTFGDFCGERDIDNIHFLGSMSHRSLLELYPEYSCLVSTSRSETFGLSVAEAIAYGTNVICTDSGGIRDFVNEDNGIIVDIGDSELLAEVIIKNVENTHPGSLIVSEDIRHKYGYSAYKSKMLAIYSAYLPKQGLF